MARLFLITLLFQTLSFAGEAIPFVTCEKRMGQKMPRVIINKNAEGIFSASLRVGMIEAGHGAMFLPVAELSCEGEETYLRCTSAQKPGDLPLFRVVYTAKSEVAMLRQFSLMSDEKSEPLPCTR